MNINRILFTGNLTADPELVDAGKTKVINAALAGNEFYYDHEEERQQVSTFVDLKIWGAAAENFAKLARRGQEIFVEGSLRQDRWEDDEGKKRSRLYVNVLSWQFTQRKSDEAAVKPLRTVWQGKGNRTFATLGPERSNPLRFLFF